MEAKIKAIIKRPDEKYGHMTWISPSLKNLQITVEGHIEVHVLEFGAKPLENLIMICNADGKNIGLEKNFTCGEIPQFRDVVVGNVIICGTSGEEFADIPIDMSQWKRMLSLWGN